MIPFLETPRLALREFRADDADDLYRLHRDPRVMRYIGDGSVGTRASVATALAQEFQAEQLAALGESV